MAHNQKNEYHQTSPNKTHKWNLGQRFGNNVLHESYHSAALYQNGQGRQIRYRGTSSLGGSGIEPPFQWR